MLPFAPALFLGPAGVAPATFVPSGPNVVAVDEDAVITASRPVIWTWTRTGSFGSASVSNGSSALEISFHVNPPATGTRSSSWNVTADDGSGTLKSWTVTVTMNGGGLA